jgi:hypothetical protein
MILIRLIIKLILFIRKSLNRYLLRIRSKMRMNSLREAIIKADDIKDKTGRKAIVVFDNGAGQYDALQKRAMKIVADKRKVKGQPKQTAFRKRHPVKVSTSRFTNARIKTLEQKSAYVTR